MKLQNWFTLSVLVAMQALTARSQNDTHLTSPDNNRLSANYFTATLEKGQKLGNIFSRTISFSGADFPEIVFRVSGTGIYTVTGADATHLYFDGSFRYDGRPEGNNKVIVTDNGKTVSYDGKAGTNTDGSGLLFNSLLWGTPPQELHPGASWDVKIEQPWELGGPGSQTIRVMEMDTVNRSVKLKREGFGEGYFDNDIKELSVAAKDGAKIKMKLVPGKCHWIGYTIFKNGLVISDELMVTRPVTLTTDSLQFKAEQREYILLNDMPVII